MAVIVLLVLAAPHVGNKYSVWFVLVTVVVLVVYALDVTVAPPVVVRILALPCAKTFVVELQIIYPSNSQPKPTAPVPTVAAFPAAPSTRSEAFVVLVPIYRLSESVGVPVVLYMPLA